MMLILAELHFNSLLNNSTAQLKYSCHLQFSREECKFTLQILPLNSFMNWVGSKKIVDLGKSNSLSSIGLCTARLAFKCSIFASL
jgi:hypothetical protein